MSKKTDFIPLSANQFNHSIEEFANYLKQQYLEIQKKNLKSKLLFIILNLLTFIMSGVIVILTSFIIGKRLGDDRIIWIFTSLSIISASITFVVGLGSLFQFKKRKQVYQYKIENFQRIINDLENNADLNAETDVQNIIESIYQSDDQI